MSVCMILDVTEMEGWDGRHGGHLVPAKQRPTIVQQDRKTAETEALRLARAHPNRQFVVFEAVSAGVTVKVPTHVNIWGRPLVSGTTAAVVRVDDEDDGIPF